MSHGLARFPRGQGSNSPSESEWAKPKSRCHELVTVGPRLEQKQMTGRGAGEEGNEGVVREGRAPEKWRSSGGAVYRKAQQPAWHERWAAGGKDAKRAAIVQKGQRALGRRGEA